MYEHNLYSLRYLCTFSYSKNNSKFTGPLLKIYVCDVIKTLLSMKVKYVYGIQNRKYTGGAVQEKKAWNTVQIISCQFYLYMNVISVLCNPNGTLFQTCLILHVWLKSIVLVFATLVSFTNYIPPPLPYFKVNIYPLPPSPLRLNMFRLFVILSLTQLYRYTLEICLFSTATCKYIYSVELDNNSQRAWLSENLNH
jgi:hypothetical protein